MYVFKARLKRGLESLVEGDVEAAAARLDEISRRPGSLEPISGMDAEGEAQFYRLQGRLAELNHDTRTAQEAFVRMTQAEWDAGLIDEDDLVFDDDDEHEHDHEDDVASGGCGCQATTASSCGCGGASEEPALLIRALEEPEMEVTYFADLDTPGDVVVLTGQQTQEQTLVTDNEIRESVITTKVRQISVVMEPGFDLPEEVEDILGLEPGEQREWVECHVEEVRTLKTTMVYRRSETPLEIQGEVEGASS